MTPKTWPELADTIEAAAWHGYDTMMRETGFVAEPAVHMVAMDLPQPYIGYLKTRPFRRGLDAAAAITALGVLPSVLAASHLLVTWENADVCTALDLPGDVFDPAVAILTAARDTRSGKPTHTLRWHPFHITVGPLTEQGLPTVIPTWAPPGRHPDASLPSPITALLQLWRQHNDAAPQRLVAELEVSGYQIRWAQPHVPLGNVTSPASA